MSTLSVNIKLNTAYGQPFDNQKYTVAYTYKVNGTEINGNICSTLNPSGYIPISLSSSGTSSDVFNSFQITNFAFCSDKFTNPDTLPSVSAGSEPVFHQSCYNNNTLSPTYVNGNYYGNIGMYQTVTINAATASVFYNFDIACVSNASPIYVSTGTVSRFNSDSLSQIKLLSATSDNSYIEFKTLSPGSTSSFVTIYPAMGAYWYAYSTATKNSNVGLRYKVTNSYNKNVINKYSYNDAGQSFISIDSNWFTPDNSATFDLYPYYSTYVSSIKLNEKKDLFVKYCYRAVYGYYSISSPDSDSTLDLNYVTISPSKINKWGMIPSVAEVTGQNNKYATYDTLATWRFGRADSTSNAYAKYLTSISLTLNNGTTDNTHVVGTAYGTSNELTVNTRQKDYSYTATFSITTRLPAITVYNYDLSKPTVTTLPMSFTVSGDAVSSQTFEYDGKTRTNTGEIKYTTVGGSLSFSDVSLTEWKHQAQKIAFTYQYADSASSKYQTVNTDTSGYIQLFAPQWNPENVSDFFGVWHDIVAYTSFVENDKYEVRVSANNTTVPLYVSYNTASEDNSESGTDYTVTLDSGQAYVGIRPYKSALRFNSISVKSPYSKIYEVNTVNIYKDSKYVKAIVPNTLNPVLEPTNITSSDGQHEIQVQIAGKGIGNIWKGVGSGHNYKIAVNGNYSQYSSVEEKVISDADITSQLWCSLEESPVSHMGTSYIVDYCYLRFYATSSATSPVLSQYYSSNVPSTINLNELFFNDNTTYISQITDTSKYVLDVYFTESTSSVNISVFNNNTFKPGFTLVTADGIQYKIAGNVSNRSLFTINSSESVDFESLTFDCPRIVGTNQLKYVYTQSDGDPVETSYFNISDIAANPIECPVEFAANHWKGVSIIPNVSELPNVSFTIENTTYSIGNYNVSVTDNGKTEIIRCSDKSAFTIATKVPANTTIRIDSAAIVDSNSDYEITGISDGDEVKVIPCEYVTGDTVSDNVELYIVATRVTAPVTVKTSGDFIKYKIYYIDYNNNECVYEVSTAEATLNDKYSAKTGSNSIKITAIEPSDDLYQLDGDQSITIGKTETKLDLNNPVILNITDTTVINVKLKRDTASKVFGVNLNTTSWGIDDAVLNYSIVLDNPYLNFGSFSYTGIERCGQDYAVNIDSSKYSGVNNISLPITYTGTNYDSWITDDEAKKLRGHVTIVSNTAGEGNETLYCVDRENYVPFTLSYNATSVNNWSLNLSKAFCKNVQKTVTYSVFIDCSEQWQATVIPYDSYMQTTADPSTYGIYFNTRNFSDNPHKLTFSDCGIKAENYGVVLKNPQIYKNGQWVNCKYKLGVMGTIIPVEPSYAVVRTYLYINYPNMKFSLTKTDGTGVVSDIMLAYDGQKGRAAVDVQLPERGDYKFKVQYWNNTGSLPEFELKQKTPATGKTWKSSSCVIDQTISCNDNLNEFYVDGPNS